MKTFTELLTTYGGSSQRKVIYEFYNWAYASGYELVVKRSADAINRELAEATAQRDEAEERIAQLKKELEQ